MSELADKIEELRRIQEGEAWHGPALSELLSDVTTEQALAKPVPGAHSIWELVLHIIGWGNVFSRRLQGQPLTGPPEGDFPQIPDRRKEAWNETVQRLPPRHAEIVKTVASLNRSRPKENVKGNN